MHGIVMIFFFLIPAIPAVLGNFLLPLMLGAKDLAFPKLNLLSWYVYNVGAIFTLYAIIAGGVDTGWTFYTPLSSVYSNGNVMAVAIGIFHQWFFIYPYGLEFHRHHSHDARPRFDLVSPASVCLGALCNQSDSDSWNSCACRDHRFAGS
jgi:hypothetical protein